MNDISKAALCATLGQGFDGFWRYVSRSSAALHSGLYRRASGAEPGHWYQKSRNRARRTQFAFFRHAVAEPARRRKQTCNRAGTTEFAFVRALYQRASGADERPKGATE